MPINIDLVERSGTGEIRDYLAVCPTLLVYVHPDYIGTIREHMDATAGWLVARENKCIQGVLPFVERNGFLGPVLNSMPYYGGNGGVIQVDTNSQVKEALIEEFFRHAAHRGACSATLITNPLLDDSEVYERVSNYDFRDERIGQITHFPASRDPGDLLDSFQDPRPRNIRRARKAGVIVSRSQEIGALEDLWHLHTENMEAIGGKAKGWRFFECLKRRLPTELWDVYRATVDNEVVGALLVLRAAKTVEYYTPAVSRERRNMQALPLVIYEAMTDAMHSGYEQWNWGGTWLSQGGVYDFKKRWGTSEYRYYYYTRIYSENVEQCSAKEVGKEYGNFYVIPFHSLSTTSQEM